MKIIEVLKKYKDESLSADALLSNNAVDEDTIANMLNSLFAIKKESLKKIEELKVKKSMSNGKKTAKRTICKIPVSNDFEDFVEIAATLLKVYSGMQGVHLSVDFDANNKDILIVRED